jgi:hypothetical protein
MDFRVKEPTLCVAPAQTVGDFVQMGNGRALGFSVVVRKEHPFRSDTTYRLIGGGSNGETGTRVVYEHDGSFYACGKFSDRKPCLMYGGLPDHEGKVSGSV